MHRTLTSVESGVAAESGPTPSGPQYITKLGPGFVQGRRRVGERVMRRYVYDIRTGTSRDGFGRGVTVRR